MAELSKDAVRDRMLTHVRALVTYWERESRAATPREKLEGLAFSVLAMLDGCAADLPGFAVIPCPHPTDREFHESQGEDWYPDPPPEVADACDIAGSLHDLFHKRGG